MRDNRLRKKPFVDSKHFVDLLLQEDVVQPMCGRALGAPNPTTTNTHLGTHSGTRHPILRLASTLGTNHRQCCPQQVYTFGTTPTRSLPLYRRHTQCLPLVPVLGTYLWFPPKVAATASLAIFLVSLEARNPSLVCHRCAFALGGWGGGGKR